MLDRKRIEHYMNYRDYRIYHDNWKIIIESPDCKWIKTITKWGWIMDKVEHAKNAIIQHLSDRKKL